MGYVTPSCPNGMSDTLRPLHVRVGMQPVPGKPIPRLRDAVMLNPPGHAFVVIKAEQAEQRKYQRSDHYSLPIGISYN